MPAPVAGQAYDDAFKRLALDARVDTFLSILAIRTARDALAAGVKRDVSGDRLAA